MLAAETEGMLAWPLRLRERRPRAISSGNREVLKEMAMSQDRDHLNHATWDCKYHVVFRPMAKSFYTPFSKCL